ncbi:unnamed protein product [Hermetia illucens]|uniref:Envelope protein n=1 Tax=Hermetia illucens TaxID=343691 RepID=A0A7R8UK40_HERIL|nr:unnamed protein product [Hermetia illucens]
MLLFQTMSPLIILTLWTAINAQTIHLEDLNNNKGYIPIKTDEVKLIDYYYNTLHTINTSEYEQTLELIRRNINILTTSTVESKTILETVNRYFELVKTKINNLIPHPRRKRGLLNFLGKGLNYVAGTMDNDDRTHIETSLKTISENEADLLNKVNKNIITNNFLSLQIKNITQHINVQQTLITNYLNKFKDISQNNIATLRDEINFLQQVYQIDNDISLLTNHITDIEQTILSSKIGLITKDILTKTELDLIDDFDEYLNIKTSVSSRNEIITITVGIPKYSKESLSKIIIEPIPTIQNRSLLSKFNTILVSPIHKIYYSNVKDNLRNNLEEIRDNCLDSIIQPREIQCRTKHFDQQEIKQITPGILIFKHFYDNFEHDCNIGNIRMEGTFMVKFENCKIRVGNKTYFNHHFRVHDKIILPKFIKSIKENNTFADIKIEELYLKQISNENDMNTILLHSKNNNIISLSSDIFIITIIILLIVLYTYMNRYSRKLVISSEPQTNSGGVTIRPTNPKVFELH